MIDRLALNPAVVDECRTLAKRVAADTLAAIEHKTTVSVERAVVRLFGVDGVDESGVPLPNAFVDALKQIGGLEMGAAYWIASGMKRHGTTAQKFVEAVASGRVPLASLDPLNPDDAWKMADAAARDILDQLTEKHARRRDTRQRATDDSVPLLYVLTATGNVYEDIVHAKAVAEHGGDIVAVIRSTAQSLLDFVPYGPTTEGYGGTYATQENFRIMREALDDWSRRNGRYVRLSSFCSGLCMPEIAVMGAIEGLDNMVNDALYGILYRDINMVRTIVDQQFSRMANGYFGITINTGEDNYLRTDDPVEAAPSVVASQLINYELAMACGVPEGQIGIGNAFEIHPDTENGLLFEIAHAELTRQLFPRCPVKYMPPTRFMDGNLFRTHANDTMFNFVSILTRQRIQTLGVPTEGIFTPHIHDRVLGLECARYVHRFAKNLVDEVTFREDGFIQRRAQAVLAGACDLLAGVNDGVFGAVQRGMFGGVRRAIDEGRGADGVIARHRYYVNPFLERMAEA
ncbi:MAG TPA: lysine 5,6-aminomutase subunit alpha [Trinickia sp.]|jgi:beta-lysine 5,6-aminomutase alpha subunit|nr:lysine 5,6-aminomutase subunit alpha [Trinickia sp.]